MRLGVVREEASTMTPGRFMKMIHEARARWKESVKDVEVDLSIGMHGVGILTTGTITLDSEDQISENSTKIDLTTGAKFLNRVGHTNCFLEVR